MKLINLFFLASTISADVVFAENTINVEDAARKGYIKLVIKSAGGYTGDVINMKIQNLTNEALALKVEAGRRLDSENQQEQDILVVKQERFVLGAKQEHTYKIYGMCCQAHNSSPSKNAVYKVGKMADSNLVKLARFVNDNKYYSDYTAQAAVWSVSDNNSIAGIEGEKEISEKLQKYVSQITGRPIPVYKIHYKQQSGNDVMGRAVNIQGVFSYSLSTKNKVTISIYNSDGKIVQTLMLKQSHEQGDYKLTYNVNTTKFPAGIYYTRMIANGAVVKEEKIEL